MSLAAAINILQQMQTELQATAELATAAAESVERLNEAEAAGGGSAMDKAAGGGPSTMGSSAAGPVDTNGLGAALQVTRGRL